MSKPLVFTWLKTYPTLDEARAFLTEKVRQPHDSVIIAMIDGPFLCISKTVLQEMIAAIDEGST